MQPHHLEHDYEYDRQLAEQEAQDAWLAREDIETVCDAREILYLLFDGHAEKAQKLITEQILSTWKKHNDRTC